MEPINIIAFSNDKKNDKQPDYSGTSKDKKLRVAVWLKPSKITGKKDNLSIKITENTYNK